MVSILQIVVLEKKFREALRWRDQTGQGILDEAEQAQRDDDAGLALAKHHDILKEAKTQTEGNTHLVHL